MLNSEPNRPGVSPSSIVRVVERERRTWAPNRSSTLHYPPYLSKGVTSQCKAGVDRQEKTRTPGEGSHERDTVFMNREQGFSEVGHEVV